MKQFQPIAVREINFSRYTNASLQSLYMEIAEILRLSGIFDTDETRELFNLYCQKYEELVNLGKYVPSLMTTTEVREACKESDLAFLHLHKELTSLKFHTSPEVISAYPQLEKEVLKQFPVTTTIRSRQDFRNQYYTIMASRLINDWSELISQVDLMPELVRLQKAVDVFNQAYNHRIEEKTTKDPGKSRCMLKELRLLYLQLMSCLEVWANNPVSVSPYRERAEKARDTIQACNVLIGKYRKSMLISAGNRRRAR